MKLQKTKKYKKKNQKKYTLNKTKKQRGGGEKEQKERIIKDKFVSMFLNSYDKLMKAIKSKNKQQIKTAINSFNNGFKSNQIGINTLIPITNNTIPILKENNSSSTPIIGFVSSLVIFFVNIDDLDILKVLTNLFLHNKGNINLKSYAGNITALSTAIKLQNKPLTIFTLENGADIDMLTDEQIIEMNNLMKEEEIEQIINNEDITPIEKLVLHDVLPNENGYDPNVEPDFWKPIFHENEMMRIRQIISSMMISDANIPIINSQSADLWSLCKINQALIPTYYVETKNKSYNSFHGIIGDQDIDFSHYNIVLCAALIIFGLISQKMIGQDYNIVFKGGKAIQLELASIPDSSSYESDDIDIMIMPSTDVAYDENKIKNLAGHISYLVKWFLNNPETQFFISVQVPNPENKRSNPFIFKLSYLKTVKRRDEKIRQMVDDFRPFSDIDFKEMPQNIKELFEKTNDYKFYISELDQHILFKCPNIGSLLDDKIYYYIKYMQFKRLLEENTPIVEAGYERLKMNDCLIILSKFKRAILALNHGLQKKRYPMLQQDELVMKEKLSIMTRLDKISNIDKLLKSMIIDSLYQ
jgi:hypothetical protein